MSSYPVTFQLNEAQKAQLQIEINNSASAGNYAGAYKYLSSTLPIRELGYSGNVSDGDIFALATWLSVAQSTNGNTGDSVDSTLRSLTKEIMSQNGIGNEYSDAKFNQFSNEMAYDLLSKIQDTGKVSLGEIINTDAQAFTRFGPTVISKNEWPGAFIDNGLLGGDWINANPDLNLEGLALAGLDGLSVAISNFYSQIKNWFENFTFDSSIDAAKNAISNVIGATPDPLVKIIIYVDPLILDLDGNGLDITPLSQGVLFDANGDQIKTGTAWVGAHDGMLVLDLNGNGLIDSGRELFGDETILANGQKASHGFAALAELDTGSILHTTTVVDGITVQDEQTLVGAGDHVFDQKDAQYNNVRVWRDVNQDGVSQADELKTLSELGIASINLQSTQSSLNYGDAMLTQISNFTRSDGSVGQAGSFILAQNNFTREFTPVTVSDAARDLSAFKGSGWVRDLREAATLNPELLTAYQQAANSQTYSEYKVAIGDLLSAWGNSSSYNSASKQALAAGYGLILSDPIDDQERGWMDQAIKFNDADRQAFRETLQEADQIKFDAMRERMVGGLEKLHAYEAFTGHTFLNWSQLYSDTFNYTERALLGDGRIPIEISVPFSRILYENRNGFVSSQDGYIRVNIPAPPVGTSHVNTLWQRLVDDASINMELGIRLSKYISLVEPDFSVAGTTYNFSQLNEQLSSALSENTYEGAIILLNFYHNYGLKLDNLGWNGFEKVKELMQNALGNADIRSAFQISNFNIDTSNFFSANAISGTENNDVFSGDLESNFFEGLEGDDLIDGQSGNDHLLGGIGNDLISGGAGNDNLRGNNGDDVLRGDGGNDQLSGGNGSDHYVFGANFGNDIIDNKIDNYDQSSGQLDSIQFIDGIDKNDLVISRNDSSDLLISTLDGQNTIIVKKYFYESSDTTSQVAFIRFSDGTTLDNEAVKQLVITGTDRADTLYAYSTGSVISGSAGDDLLVGASGIDVLRGGIDNDEIYGNNGDDQIEGGEGNDILAGGSGHDEYVFMQTWGQDQINTEWNKTIAEKDSLSFKDLNSTEILIRKESNNMVVMKIGTDDRISVFNQFDPYTSILPINQITFQDGTIWNEETLKQMAIKGTASDDVIESVTIGDIIHAGLGNDFISGIMYGEADRLFATNQFFGEDGDDTISGHGVLDGGAGDDVLTGTSDLRGGSGNDVLIGSRDQMIFVSNGFNMTQTQDGYYLVQDSNTPESERFTYLNGGKGQDTIHGTFSDEIYLFNVGDGQDTIIERRLGENYSNVILSYDIIRFGEGIIANDLSFERTADDLKIKYTNNLDEITIENYFVLPNGHYKIDELQFSDGSILTQQEIENKIYYRGGATDDLIWGYRGNDTVFAGAGNDHVQARAGDDTVYGEAGNDALFGENGNDTLNGGLGSDYLDGGSGNDTYVFAKGGATDTYNFRDNVDAFNVVKITGYQHTEVFAQRQDDSIYLSFKNSSDRIWLSNYYVADTTDEFGTVKTNKVDQIEFDSGVIWTQADIQTSVDRAASNRTPTVNGAIPQIKTNQGAAFSYTIPNTVITDPDVWDSLTFRVTATTQTNGQYNPIPSWLSFDPETRTLSGTPPAGTTGNLSFYYWGTDLYGSVIGTPFSLTVNPPNRPPVIANPIIDQTATDGKAFSYTIASNAFSDPDGDALAYSATLEDGSALPAWLSFNATTRTISGTSPDNSSPLNVRVTARDTANQTVSDVFKITFVVQNLTVNGTTAADNLSGGSGNDTLTGQAGNDTLYGLLGNDTLNGGTGNDIMYGGRGDDVYVVDSTSDSVNESANEGTDTVQSSVTLSLSANVENLTLTGTTAINGTGNSLNNTLTGNTANNSLNGGAGDDVLDGGAGTDTLIGGVGNDVYIVDSTTDTLTENANEGADTVRSSVTYTLTNANLENLTLLGTAAINGTGNALNNTLIGNSANNTLSGGTGVDSLIGGLGNDTYIVDHVSDLVVENAAEGTDTVQSSVSYSLVNHVENITLTGTAVASATGNDMNNALTGNSANNTLNGGAGDDTLNGGAGTDTLIGGTGNDIYVIDSTTDVITENANEGTDTVQSTVTYTLTNANLDNLTLTGTSAINGTGNTLSNTIIGNSAVNTLTGGAGDDWLDGGAGNDKLLGGAGNDTYVIDSTTDVVTEAANEGIDTLSSTVTYTLGSTSNLENLTLLGTAAINATGNALDNVLIGNSAINTLTGGLGNDWLDGGAGNDKLLGGAGNDTYVIDSASDAITENANEGTDSVQSTVTYTLGSNLENLELIGAAAINATGNTLANTLKGNSANNLLTGGTGSDRYLFDRNSAVDTIVENDTTAGNKDQLAFAADIAANQLWFTKTGNNLEVSVIGTGNKVVVKDWYLGNAYHVEELKSGNGLTLINSQVQNLVNAMSSLTPPAAGQTTLPAEYQTQLNAVIASNWQ